MTDQQAYIKSIIEEPLYTVEMKVNLLDIYVKQAEVKSAIQTWERSREIINGMKSEANE
jgi:hypothetical protein